jgi:hypothetical protein
VDKKYRMLHKGEKVIKGDEFLFESPDLWRLSTNCYTFDGNQSLGIKYRRPLKNKVAGHSTAHNSTKVTICACFKKLKRCAWFCDRKCRLVACKDTRKQ